MGPRCGGTCSTLARPSQGAATPPLRSKGPAHAAALQEPRPRGAADSAAPRLWHRQMSSPSLHPLPIRPPQRKALIPS
eukprot:15482300-Alexandrium_andersonii.AAC.1